MGTMTNTAVLESQHTQIANEIRAARAESDRLFSILTPEALYARPINERHRVIFYLGHLDAFDSIQICRESLGIPSEDEKLDALFQAGIDPDSAHLPTDQPRDWPSIEQVRAYVDRARRRVDEHLEEAREDVCLMVLEHRLMHLETLAYMFHNFDYGWKQRPEGEAVEAHVSGPGPLTEWIEIPDGHAIIGKQRDGQFGWDNEYTGFSSHIAGFLIARYKVTNGDYLRYVKQLRAPMPHFWAEREGGRLVYRGMFEDIDLPLDWPVYVTHAEAEAYAQWNGSRLPTEPEFHRAAFGTLTGANTRFPWGDAEPDHTRGNFDFKRWDPEAVAATPAGDSTFGVSQLVGNGWEWTSSPFGPFPGFEPQPTYPGYSANFFGDVHRVLKGGSQRTAARLLRRSFRNWFRRDYPYVYGTFRCVQSQER